MVLERLTFGILGPLQALVDGRPVETAMASQRALLAVLLLRANQVVTTGALIEDLWGPTPPAQAEAAVRMAVSRLRRQLGPAGAAGLVTRRGGYLLQVAPEQIDAGRFERLVWEGQRALAAEQAQVAAERLGAGLALWRGPVLADVAAMAVVVAERERLEGMRLAALLARVRADEALGHHAEALAAWQALAAERPLDEGVCAGLLRALCRAGRQVEALEVYRGLRQRLVDELGVEPTRALQQLERQILAGDPRLQPTLSPTPAEPVRLLVPAELPPDVGGFTGRDGELAELERVLVGGGASGPVVLTAVQGTGGIGKSALAIHAAHRLAERFPDGQVYVNLQGATPGLAPLGPGEVLGRLLRSLGVDPAQVPADTEEAAARWRSLVAGRRLLLVLDNARDAAQVRPLLPASPSCTVLVTSRQPLTTLEGAVAVALGGLADQEAVELLGRIAGAERIAAEPDAAAELARCCGCLPLALRIAGARLAARPGWPVSELAGRLADRQRRLDELATGDLAVRACFEVSLTALRDSPDPLDRSAAEAFGLLALPDGPDLDALAAARLLDLPPARAERVLERLADAALLQPARPGRYQFHDLLCLYAREQAARQHPHSQRLAALTRLLGFYTATAWRTLELLRPGDRRVAGADPRWSQDGVGFAGEMAALAWLEAERANLLAAVEQAGTLAPAIPAELAGQLVRALLGFFLVRSYWNDGVRANQTALELARRTGDRAAQAHAHDDLGSIYWRLERYEEALASSRQSLVLYRELGDRHGQASCLSNRGLVSWRLGRYDQAQASLRESLAISRELGDRRGQSSSLGNLGMVYERRGRYREALACHQQSLAIDRELADRHGQAATLGNLGRVQWRLGRHDEALASQRESLAIFRELGDRWGQAASLNDVGIVCCRLGRHDEALASQRESLAIFRELDDHYGQAEALRDIGDVLLALGHHQQARASWLEALEIFAELEVPEAEEVRARLAAMPAGAAS
jgi:DNA-binding SARP family transcriptional activator/Tfp pilus assembly protein PilF